MTREELEQKARMLAQNNWPDVASKLIIALVVEACCATMNAAWGPNSDLPIRATFLPTESANA